MDECVARIVIGIAAALIAAGCIGRRLRRRNDAVRACDEADQGVLEAQDIVDRVRRAIE